MLVGLVALVTLSSLYLALRGSGKPLEEPTLHHAAQVSANAQAPEVAAMVDRLAARMRQEPGNGSGWRMLAKSYAALGRFADSAAAYGQAAALLPPDAGLLADYADVSAMAQSGDFQGEPARLVRQALDLDGRHPKALTLAGTEAYRRGDFASARQYWTKRCTCFRPTRNSLPPCAAPSRNWRSGARAELPLPVRRGPPPDCR
jgi:cytochrome c-type biogenesis protein CcmH